MAETASAPRGRPITADEFDALPIDTSHRYEIEDGFLLVNARPAAPHSRAIKRLLIQLDSQLPAGFEAFAELEAELIGRSPRRVPDVVVADSAVGDQQRVRADQIEVAIEIATSGESAVRDYAVKAGEYAANSIAHYWVIDILDPASVGLTVYTLDQGEYRITPRATGSVALSAPFPLTIDLDALTGARKV
ncbi:Uma2 family endonuclease [Nocardia asteroides]|uniref:Uma2 family endonuclease n=1 Tax=Nocardia asteroides TaxID=1824 RepID=UPI001E465C91|nr:Uma2 family endonuclease [Nocardia asteroides]UGT52601.1 Uma2 family endonuclease [Nocardia asteroides]